MHMDKTACCVTCLQLTASCSLCQVKATEHSAERLIKTLRELPSKEALALRSEVATAVLAHVNVAEVHVKPGASMTMPENMH